MNRKTNILKKAIRGRLTAMAAVATCALLLAGSAPLGLAQGSTPKDFSSPEQASRALFLAVKADDDRAMMTILGTGKALITLENEAQDKQQREQFVHKYQEMHRLVREPDRTTVLYIGAENWPFPVPLVSRNGTWHFDPRTGMREVLYRRIGENETKAIEASHALAEGKEEEPANSIAALLKTSNDGSASENEPVQSNGYYFRTLGGQQKNAPQGNKQVSFIAYPVEYRKTGVMTFIVGDDDTVYQKDLGPNTAKLAKTMTTYKPSTTWRPAE